MPTGGPFHASLGFARIRAWDFPELSGDGHGVEVLQGQVSINRGEGYQPVVDWVPASPGDLVMASPDGSGRITYSDGCVVQVEPGAVVTIQEKSPCTSGQTGFKPGYLIGGVLVAGAIAGVIVLTGDDDGEGKKALTKEGPH